MVVKLDELLTKPEYERDTTPEGIPDDPTPKALFGRGERLFREGKYEGAKAAYLQALEQDPELPFLAAGLFRCYFALGDYDNAYNQLENMLEEQKIAERDASIFRLLLDAGYDDAKVMKQHLNALKEECEARPLSWKPWLVYGIVLLDRKDYASALDAMQTWHDNVPGERDPLLLKFYELARERAS
jgi:tetratricopeptide (TPR) repeat protein